MRDRLHRRGDPPRDREDRRQDPAAARNRGAPALPRAEFGLPDHPFLFLFTFDYNSFVKRKNPEAVIAAFRQRFPRGATTSVWS